MRAGGYTVQQALTPEAATVVKQAINLARRRGHAQVTPLHVANTMLSSSTGLLRAACLQSHSHPLQCKALELCFNVALNRLPASTLSAPMLGLPQADHHHHLHPPSLSNALVAAFKRAQAHQRRGSIETQQQQPLLAVKIELEQLVISILDDPSVSRVMREAGFSSTQVKSNVEQAVSVEICSSTPPSCTPPPTGKTRTLVQVKNEDVMSVTDALVSRRKKSIVIVGECLVTAEAVVGGVRDRVHKGEVPEVSRNLQFITLPLFSFRQMPAEEVDQKVGELRCFVKSCCVETGVVLYLKDLDWAAEYRASRGEKGRSYYCSLEHILMEIKNLAFGGTEGEHSNERIWLMAIATYQTYTRFCRTGSPSLETLLALQPLTIPAGGLGLSLNVDSGLSEIRSKISGVQFLPPAADEIGSPEVPSLHINSRGSLCSMSSGLPSWLRRCKEEGNRDRNSGDQGCRQLKELCRQWNSICTSTHKSDNHPSEITFNFSSVSPSSSSNVSSYDGHSRSLHQNQQPSLLPRKAKRPWSEHHFWISEEAVDEGPEQKPGNKARENAGQKLSTFPFLYLNSHPNSNSSGSTMKTELSSKFKELNAENFKFLCDALERKVTWQQDIIPEIASIVLQCRSGLMRRKGKSKSSEKKEETWLLFQGSDTEGKERIGRELARLVFGSSTNFITVGHSNLSSTQSDSTDVLLQIKRSRAEASHSRLQSLFEAIREDPHRVIMMEDIEQVDHYTLAGIMRAMERGKLQSYGGEEVSLRDAIIILSCESFDSRSRACSPLIKQRAESEDDKEVDTCVSLDLNLCAADEDLDDHCFDSAGLLECVDRAFFFNLPDVL